MSAYETIKRQALECHASQRDDWQPLLADREWLTIDYFRRVLPPASDGAAPETTILDG